MSKKRLNYKKKVLLINKYLIYFQLRISFFLFYLILAGENVHTFVFNYLK